MSLVNKKKLKGVFDTTLAFFVTTLSLQNQPLVVDTLTMYNAYCRSFRIVNRDATAQVDYIQGSPSDVKKTIPVLSEVIVDGWESYIKVTPDPSTFAGFLEMDLVTREEAEK